MKNFSIKTDADGVALITFDMPGKGMNVISFEVQQEFEEVVETLRSRADIRGVVLVSGKPSGFCAGADLTEILGHFDGWRAAQSQAELRQGLAESASWSRRLRALETCGKPVAVAIAGMALGGLNWCWRAITAWRWMIRNCAWPFPKSASVCCRALVARSG